MIHKITPSQDYNYRLKHLDTTIKKYNVVNPMNKKCYFKTLRKSVINTEQPNVPFLPVVGFYKNCISVMKTTFVEVKLSVVPYFTTVKRKTILNTLKNIL